MSRARILADTIARLEAERYAPSPRGPQHKPASVMPVEQLTPEQQARNRRILEAAIGGDLVLIDSEAS